MMGQNVQGVSSAWAVDAGCSGNPGPMEYQGVDLAIVCVVVACFFGAISGSGPATVAALGIILIPAMINRGGFSAPFDASA